MLVEQRLINNLAKVKMEIDSKGFFVQESVQLNEVVDIAGRLGNIAVEADVKVKHNGKGPLVTSAKALELHTDHPAVKYIAWYCFHNPMPGGSSILSDFRMFSSKFNSEELEQLQQIYIYKHNIFNECVEVKQPFLHIDDDKKMMIYFSFWLVDRNDRTNSVVKTFRRYASESSWKLHLNAGSVLIVDNHRMLHGRMAIRNLSRHLRRFWIC
ncbi:MAG: TauD/TfdA family dioxygenase [Candidatus Porifericomitaceae bacterium WSBS_2022_MAG_OTU9]